jgi:gluconolactonase
MAWDWELLAGPATITEGPAWDGAGLFFTSIDDDEIRRFDPATGAIATVYRNARAANGLAFGPDGALYACEGAGNLPGKTGGRALVRYDTAGRRQVLADRFEGRRLNSPNDLALARAGGVWFTDPRYGDPFDRELDHDSVYRIAPPTADANAELGADAVAGAWSIRRMTFDTTRPNGLLLSWDERTLYVAQSDYAAGSVRQLRAYPIAADGGLSAPTVLHDFGPDRGIDGMCWDADGAIVATCGWLRGGPGPRIAVFAADGTVLEEHVLPAGEPTNCAFAGSDLDVLYVTTLDGRLYRVANTGRRGHLGPPTARPFLGEAA